MSNVKRRGFITGVLAGVALAVLAPIVTPIKAFAHKWIWSKWRVNRSDTSITACRHSLNKNEKGEFMMEFQFVNIKPIKNPKTTTWRGPDGSVISITESK